MRGRRHAGKAVDRVLLPSHSDHRGDAAHAQRHQGLDKSQDGVQVWPTVCLNEGLCVLLSLVHLRRHFTRDKTKLHPQLVLALPRKPVDLVLEHCECRILSVSGRAS